jgi:hypothetical protein
MDRRPRRATALLLAIAVVAACGATPIGQSPDGSIATPTGSEPAPPPATPTARPTPAVTPTATPVAPVTPNPEAAPRELQGTWTGDVNGTRVDLTITDSTYRIRRGSNTAMGRIAVRGERARFFGSSLCSGDGTYNWRVDGESLTLTPVAPDACPGRADAIVDVAYTLALPPA